MALTFNISPFAGGTSPSTESSLTATTNYLYSLCGKYLAQARVIYGNATGTVVVPGYTPKPITYEYPLILTIGAGQAGVNTYQNDSFKNSFGWTNIVIQSQVFQYWDGVSVVQPNNPFTINTTTGVLTFTNYQLTLNDVVTGTYYKNS